MRLVQRAGISLVWRVAGARGKSSWLLYALMSAESLSSGTVGIARLPRKSAKYQLSTRSLNDRLLIRCWLRLAISLNRRLCSLGKFVEDCHSPYLNRKPVWVAPRQRYEWGIGPPLILVRKQQKSARIIKESQHNWDAVSSALTQRRFCSDYSLPQKQLAFEGACRPAFHGHACLLHFSKPG